MSDLIRRQDAIDAVYSETVSTNPEHFKSSEKFIKFMDDVDIASFGQWQWANGFNTALVATRVQLKKLPSAQPEPQWIPCSERLPKDGTYLVYAPCYTGGSSSAKEWYNGVMFSKCKNGKWSIEHGYYSRPNCVVAWMPLPEPYGEEQNDEID